MQASPPGSWRSFGILLPAPLAVGGAARDLIASRAGDHAFRRLLPSFVGVVVALGAGLAVDWTRMDRWTRAFQVAALATCLLSCVVIAFVSPGRFQQMWNT